MRQMTKGVVFGVALALSGTLAHAATQHILGKLLQIKNPTGAETRRQVRIVGREPGCTDTIVGDPIANGGTLQILATGGMAQNQAFALPATGWETFSSNGFKWHESSNPTPVSQVKIWKGGTGVCQFNALVKGAAGGSLDILPPNPGAEGGAILTINGGDTYCIHFGATDGGLVGRNDSTMYKVISPTGELDCPTALATTTSTSTSSSTSSTSTSSTSSTTIPCDGTIYPSCNGDCPPGETCTQDGAGGCTCITIGAPCTSFLQPCGTCHAGFCVGACEGCAVGCVDMSVAATNLGCTTSAVCPVGTYCVTAFPPDCPGSCAPNTSGCLPLCP